MSRRIITLLAFTGLLAACAAVDDDAGARTGIDSHTVQQPVILEFVFELEGLDELPDGLTLDELHMGVGGLFLEQLDTDSGIAYAHPRPFQLNFEIKAGSVVARAPNMTLPQGGDYQVSVQLEPQILRSPEVSSGVVASVGDGEEASLSVSGTVNEATYPLPGDDSEDTPVPLPWYPDEAEESGDLRRDIAARSFTYISDRTVRFSVDQVELLGGTRNELTLRLDIGAWVAETIQPALAEFLGAEQPDQEGAESPLKDDIDLTEPVGELDGMDALIGGMDVEARELP